MRYFVLGAKEKGPIKEDRTGQDRTTLGLAWLGLVWHSTAQRSTPHHTTPQREGYLTKEKSAPRSSTRSCKDA